VVELGMDLSEKYPQIKEYHEALVREGIRPTDVEVGRKEQWLALILDLPSEVKDLMGARVRKMGGGSVFWQDPGSYHVTLQGSRVDEVNAMTLEKAAKVLTGDMPEILGGLSKVEAKLVYPIVGQTGVYGVVNEGVEEIREMRRAVFGKWKEFGVEVAKGFGANSLPMVFLGRFVRQPTEVEMRQLLQMEETWREPVVLDRVMLNWADKFQTSATRQVLGEWSLK